jgi:murein DD-endopeptidase MepM/ murein hydrolase activator NlpD
LAGGIGRPEVTSMTLRCSLLAVTVLLTLLVAQDARAARRRPNKRPHRRGAVTMPLPPHDVKEPADVARCSPATPVQFEAFGRDATPEAAATLESVRNGSCAEAVYCAHAQEPLGTLFVAGCGERAPVRLERDADGRTGETAIGESGAAVWRRSSFPFAPGAPSPEAGELVPARDLPRLIALWSTLDASHPGRSATATFELLFVQVSDEAPSVWRGVRIVDGGRLLEAAFLVEREGVPNGYFGLGGRSVSETFLAAPLDGFRISRGVKWFSMKVRRRGPVHGRRGRGRGRGRVMSRLRLHEGIDFAAPTGTPIRATGDGVVSFAGWKGGYGNFVVIAHRGGYATRYGHMSAFAEGIEEGAPVHEGEVIGFVGSTGLSTGPHVHYELRLNDRVLDPETWAPQSLVRLTRDELAVWMADFGRLLDAKADLGTLEATSATTAHAPTHQPARVDDAREPSGEPQAGPRADSVRPSEEDGPVD